MFLALRESTRVHGLFCLEIPKGLPKEYPCNAAVLRYENRLVCRISLVLLEIKMLEKCGDTTAQALCSVAVVLR